MSAQNTCFGTNSLKELYLLHVLNKTFQGQIYGKWAVYQIVEDYRDQGEGLFWHILLPFLGPFFVRY